eukprot:COSAG01_NODE_72613_length_252_cov_1.039216_1_plen_54_part_01
MGSGAGHVVSVTNHEARRTRGQPDLEHWLPAAERMQTAPTLAAGSRREARSQAG